MVSPQQSRARPWSHGQGVGKRETRNKEGEMKRFEEGAVKKCSLAMSLLSVLGLGDLQSCPNPAPSSFTFPPNTSAPSHGFSLPSRSWPPSSLTQALTLPCTFFSELKRLLKSAVFMQDSGSFQTHLSQGFAGWGSIWFGGEGITFPSPSARLLSVPHAQRRGLVPSAAPAGADPEKQQVAGGPRRRSASEARTGYRGRPREC